MATQSRLLDSLQACVRNSIALKLGPSLLCIAAACSSHEYVGPTVPHSFDPSQHTQVVIDVATQMGTPVTDAIVSVSPKPPVVGMTTYSLDTVPADKDGRYVVLVRRTVDRVFQMPDTISATIHARTTTGTYSTPTLLRFAPLDQEPPTVEVKITTGTE